MTWPLMAAGAYVGEIVIRQIGGAWRYTDETAARNTASGPLVVELPGKGSAKGFCNPLGKAWKRFDQGAGESIPYFFLGLKRGLAR